MDAIEKKRRLMASAEQIIANIARDLLMAKDFEAQLTFACGRERDLIMADIHELTAKIERDGKRAKVFTAAALQIVELQQATPPSNAVN